MHACTHTNLKAVYGCCAWNRSRCPFLITPQGKFSFPRFSCTMSGYFFKIILHGNDQSKSCDLQISSHHPSPSLFTMHFYFSRLPLLPGNLRQSSNGAGNSTSFRSLSFYCNGEMSQARNAERALAGCTPCKASILGKRKWGSINIRPSSSECIPKYRGSFEKTVKQRHLKQESRSATDVLQLKGTRDQPQPATSVSAESVRW